MAVRTTRVAIKDVLSTSLEDTQIDRFISDASFWVDEEIADEGLSSGRLEIIERYLACALIRLRDLGLKSAKYDDIAEQYQVDPTVTDYLLRAASFDNTGLVRRFFMAPRDTRVARARVGQSFVDEAGEV